jgi:pyrroline-5-carboxylate reductase
MALKLRRIAFIGGGHITSIILENLTRSGKTTASQLIVSDPDLQKLESLQKKFSVQTTENNQAALGAAEFIFFNVLPQVVDPVLNEFKEQKFPKDKLIISLAAGIPIKTYAVIGNHIPVVRALPNPPSQIGKGIAALAFNPYVSEPQRNDVIELFSCLGEYVILEEEKINAITALSSPVTTHLFFQAIIAEALEAGYKKAAEFST